MNLPKNRNRKSKKYLKYVGIVVFVSGISLVLTSAFILFSPYFFSNSLVSPLPSIKSIKESDIKQILKDAKIDVSSFSLATDSSYIVDLKEGGRVIFARNKSLSSQVRSLQIILSRLTIDGKKLRSLDFRFDKPVVSF